MGETKSRPAKAPRRLETELVSAGNWLTLERITYRDDMARVRTWEAAGRKQGREAVCVIARLVPSQRYVLVLQYRPPADAFVVEFPAGLVDPGESAVATALRELQEETGYRGCAVAETEPALNSAGFSSEAAALVFVDIDETAAENRLPHANLEDGEQIEVLLLHPQDFPTVAATWRQRGWRVDGKVLAFFHRPPHWS